MFHFDVVKSLLFFVSHSRIYIYEDIHLILDFSIVYFSLICFVTKHGVGALEDSARTYRIIAYGWLEFVWQYEWFIIRGDTLSGARVIFAMYAIVYDLDNCLCYSVKGCSLVCFTTTAAEGIGRIVNNGTCLMIH